MATMLGGVALPRLYVQDVEDDWVGKPIRRWTLRTRPVTLAEHNAIANMVRTVGVARTINRAIDGTPHTTGASQVSLMLDEGGNETTVTHVYITSFRAVRPVRLPRRRELEFVLEEA